MHHSIFSDVLIRKLQRIAPLSFEEKAALAAMPIQATAIGTDQDIVREGDRPSRSCILLEGFACTWKVTGDGKRQIISFYVPGDMPDLLSLHLKEMDQTLTTITPCKVGFVTHEVLRDLCLRFPQITAAFWRDTLIDGAIFREWIVNTGRRDAKQRVAHLLCELLARLQVVGLIPDHTCAFPITQLEMSDATGLSTVHINRVIQELRADGLIRLEGRMLTALDWERLQQVGDFDPTYLHMGHEQQAAA